MSQFNARQFEKDIFADQGVNPTEGGDSEVVDLFRYGGASKFSAQAIYDVTSYSAKTFDSGGAEIDTATFAAKASTGDGDYMVVYDTAGLAWAIAADLTGSSPEPTGAVWDAIPAGQKAQVDLSSVLIVTDAEVATAFQDAFNLLTDVPITANDSTATVVFTGDLYGAVTAPEVHDEDDSGPGSISIAITDAGVNSEVNVADNEITIPSHGMVVGLKVQLSTTGTLPAPFLVSTDYFVIVLDANTIQLAATEDLAEAGTAIALVDQGSDEAVNTVTQVALAGGSVTFYKSNDSVNWITIQTATTVSADGSVMIEQANVSYRYFKVTKAITSGAFSVSCQTLVIGDAL